MSFYFGQVHGTIKDNSTNGDIYYCSFEITPDSDNNTEKVKITRTANSNSTVVLQRPILEKTTFYDILDSQTGVTYNIEGGYINEKSTIAITTSNIKVIPNVLKSISNVKRASIQTSPGTVMCINGEIIRMGITGIYEINFDMGKIESIGFIPNGTTNFYIVDYQYEGGTE